MCGFDSTSYDENEVLELQMIEKVILIITQHLIDDTLVTRDIIASEANISIEKTYEIEEINDLIMQAIEC